MSQLDVISDNSMQNLETVPEHVLQMTYLKMLYLQDNLLKQLPDDFFLKLPLLTWLDLRNNDLVSIPASIAYHQHLENLLLSNNRIEYLPNEIGLVPNLKVLQLGGNPLIYPERNIVVKGTQAVCAFLKNEYETHNRLMQDVIEEEEEEEEEREKNQKLDEKKSEPIKMNISEQIKKSNSNVNVKDCASASLMVKGLSSGCPNKVVHRLSKSATKISLKSSYKDINNVPGLKKSTQTIDSFVLNEMKNSWFEKIRVLLADQEKILQQERNLKALSSWRTQRKMEPIRYIPKDEIPEAPFATDPAYNLLMTRDDLSEGIDKMINKSSPLPPKQDIEKLINDLAAELKDMEVNYNGTHTPQTQIDVAGKQIQLIMDIHKKLLKLQEENAVQ